MFSDYSAVTSHLGLNPQVLSFDHYDDRDAYLNTETPHLVINDLASESIGTWLTRFPMVQHTRDLPALGPNSPHSFAASKTNCFPLLQKSAGLGYPNLDSKILSLFWSRSLHCTRFPADLHSRPYSALGVPCRSFDGKRTMMTVSRWPGSVHSGCAYFSFDFL